jgi:hypothetical protein
MIVGRNLRFCTSVLSWFCARGLSPVDDEVAMQCDGGACRTPLSACRRYTGTVGCEHTGVFKHAHTVMCVFRLLVS